MGLVLSVLVLCEGFESRSRGRRRVASPGSEVKSGLSFQKGRVLLRGVGDIPRESSFLNYLGRKAICAKNVKRQVGASDVVFRMENEDYFMTTKIESKIKRKGLTKK